MEKFMNSGHDWHETSVTRWAVIAVGIAVLMTLAAVVSELGRQTYPGHSEMRQPAIASPVARDRPAIDQQRTSDTSVPAAQAAFEHSRAVSEDLPPTF